MATKVEMWESEDGKLWKSEQEAEQYDYLRSKIAKVAEVLGCSGAWLEQGSWEDVAAHLLAYYDLIAKTGD